MVPPELNLVVHSTHEAGLKVGGIGAVLEGLLSQPAYNNVVNRTVLVGPFSSADPLERERLRSQGNRLSIIYSSLEEQHDLNEELARAFERIELYYHVKILYGKRRFGEYEHEVLLVDPVDVVSSVVNNLKYHLWEHFQIDSRRYEGVDEFDRFLGAAEPGFAALQALVGEGSFSRPPEFRSPRTGNAVLIAHEWLGLPLIFSALVHQPKAYRTVFYAHEVATARLLVEGNPGYDTRFYNAMHAARRQELFLEQVFGDQSYYFKHALLLAAGNLDERLAVSDITVDELQFLSPTLAARPMAMVYNGVPSPATRLEERQASKSKLRQYADALIGTRPTWIFSHVTRMVVSKGLWRDLSVMEELDRRLASRGETAVLFTLSSAIPTGRPAENGARWEAEYGWPVHHRDDNGDLVGLEIDYYRQAEKFNRSAAASHVILVNQFGFSRERCGLKMPADLNFEDLRRGTDLEFGLSIYEPFGIGQLEPLSSGAICCLSSVCGCVGFIKQVGRLDTPNIVIGDYVSLPPGGRDLTLEELIALGAVEREQVEAREAVSVAEQVIERLPRTDSQMADLIEQGSVTAQKLSWKVVVEELLLPALLNML